MNQIVNKQLVDVAEKLKKAGASVPAPPAGGTIESAMRHGLSIALVVVEEAIAAAEQAQQTEPVLPAVKESLTTDRQAEPVAWFYSDNLYKKDNLYRRTVVRDIAEEFARQGRRVIAQYDAAQAPAMADNCIPVPAEWLQGLLLGDRQHHIELRAMLAAAPQAAAEDSSVVRSVVAVPIYELEAILNDADAHPPTHNGCCEECGSWTPRDHPEAHDHKKDCTAPAEYAKRRDWEARLSALIAAAQKGGAA